MIKYLYLGLLFLCLSCSSLMKDYDEGLLKTDEYDEQIQVQKMETSIPEVPWATDKKAGSSSQKISKEALSKISKVVSKKGQGASPTETKTSELLVPTGTTAKIPISSKKKPHLPAMEDGEGFNGRRPLVDPLRVGERAVYSISYFGVEAGKFTIEIKPFVQVNNKKSWHIYYTGRTTSVFSLFYAVNDTAEAFLDYEKLIPYSYSIHVKESKMAREVRSYFNWKKLKGNTWDKKLKKGEKLKKEQYSWDILPYSQNVFTVSQYLRHFTLKVGKKISVRVGHEGKNIIMTAKVIRREMLKTSVGKIKAFVIKPSFEVDGLFKPVGDIRMWLSDDDRKIVLRIESKIKIGTIVASVEELRR